MYIWTCKFAPRHDSVHFSDVSTSKSGPDLVCFVYILANVLRATTVCTFPTPQLPTVVRTWCGLYSLTSKFASRHNGVQFHVSAAATLTSLLFNPPELQIIIGKKRLSYLSYLCTCVFFLVTFSMSELLPGCAFPSVDYLHVTYYNTLNDTQALKLSVSHPLTGEQIINFRQGTEFHMTYLQDSQ